MDGLGELLTQQDGTVSRRQLLGLGLGPSEVRRLLRRRDLVLVHPGAYVDHTGPLTWQQRAWSSVHSCWPAALTHESALRAYDGPGSPRPSSPIHVAVGLDRRLDGPPGVVVHRTDGLDDRVRWNLGPPRVVLEAALVDVACGRLRDLDAVADLAGAVQHRQTTVARLRAQVDERIRLPRRSFLLDVLDDLAEGTCSALEHGYLTRVERPHGLAGARRQVRDRLGAATVYRDVTYAGARGVLVVELDGRWWHDTAAQRDRTSTATSTPPSQDCGRCASGGDRSSSARAARPSASTCCSAGRAARADPVVRWPAAPADGSTRWSLGVTWWHPDST